MDDNEEQAVAGGPGSEHHLSALAHSGLRTVAAKRRGPAAYSISPRTLNPRRRIGDSPAVRKVCPTCRLEKTAEEFGHRINSSCLRYNCKKCYNENHSKRYRIKRGAQGHEPRRMGPNVPWAALGENLPIAPVSMTRKEKRRLYNARYKSRKQYGISFEEYSERMEKNNGWCAMCLTRENRTDMVMDHDHSTGKIRGVICRKCNSGLGMFGDDPEKLMLALSYLARNGKEFKCPTA